MQAQGKINKFLSLFVLFFFLFSISVKADTLQDAISAYKDEEFKKAIKLLKTEIGKGNNDPELYNWLGRSYEAIFDIDNAIESYTKYENLKKNNAFPSASALPSSGTSPNITPSPEKTAVPTKSPLAIKPTPTIKPSKLPTPKPTVGLAETYKGWSYFEVVSYSLVKKIKIIPKNSIDLSEIEENAGKGKEFLVVSVKLQYKKDIIIKSNSKQITAEDSNGNLYNIYAISTYKFQYQGNSQQIKSESLQIADYYQLSKKDSRSALKIVFKVNEDKNFKNIKILGYNKLVPMKNKK